MMRTSTQEWWPGVEISVPKPVSRAKGVSIRHGGSEPKEGEVRLPSREPDVRCCLRMGVEGCWPGPLSSGY